ncbi:hypothetical protein [Streptococcus mutans]|uniref:hypothetical protein n=2 Tax=Streptococcus mutans TaxID=1309 RepID=UPI001145F76B|nr:hypothetical protein [Streptococcus mutans]NLR27375.1 hypothetical protein [Streptococcus mutans]
MLKAIANKQIMLAKELRQFDKSKSDKGCLPIFLAIVSASKKNASLFWFADAASPLSESGIIVTDLNKREEKG